MTTQIIGHQHEYFLLANISKWGIMCYSHCSWLLTLNWLKRIIQNISQHLLLLTLFIDRLLSQT